jgi:NADH-quinone oxidoreductase subunit G
VIGAGNVFLGGRPDGEGDAILRHPDKNPNVRGVTALCTTAPPRTMHALASAVAAGEVTALLALGSAVRDLADASALRVGSPAVVLATHTGGLADIATVLLPASSWAEQDGTSVNAKGMAQESEQAIGPVGEARPAWKLAAALALRLGRDLGWRRLADVRRAMSSEAGAVVVESATQVAGAPS